MFWPININHRYGTCPALGLAVRSTFAIFLYNYLRKLNPGAKILGSVINQALYNNLGLTCESGFEACLRKYRLMDFKLLFFFQERRKNEVVDVGIGVWGPTAAFQRAPGLYFLVTFLFAQKKNKKAMKFERIT